MPKDNLAVYSGDEVVSHYASASGLMPPERYLFAKLVRPGLAILDIGVGGGRTTPFLAPGSARYLGIDYSQGMVDACRSKFPELEFATADACDLAAIGDGEFDLVIFSFNGIDSLPSDEARRRALAEMRRVAKPEGRIVISSHNARQLVLLPVLEGADLPRAIWRIVRAVGRSAVQFTRALSNAAFWRGRGYLRDPVHGGFHSHLSTRASIAEDCRAAGLEIEEAVGAFHPRRVPPWANNWTTYVLRRPTAS